MGTICPSNFAMRLGLRASESTISCENSGMPAMSSLRRSSQVGSGDRIKNDKRDALNLARLLRAGWVMSIFVPDVEQTQLRDLSRLRGDATTVQMQSRHQLKSFLLRYGFAYKGGRSWGVSHFKWLATHKCRLPTPDRLRGVRSCRP